MLRRAVHDLRLYYKSRHLFVERLKNPLTAFLLPILPSRRELTIEFLSGRTLRLPAGRWRLLPGACRLDAIGAEVELLDEAKRVRVAGVTLYSPLWSRSEAQFYREVFIDDSYGIKDRDLRGQVVVDIGAYVGDSAIAFARRGARVHAVEPSASCCELMRRNIAANQLDGNVIVHPVGLGERQAEVRLESDTLSLVEGIDYTLSHLPRQVDLLKIDCEGGEYYLLDNPRFLDHLRPLELRMEYHRGAGPILQRLAEAGYEAQIMSEEPNGKVGLIKAHRGRTAPLGQVPAPQVSPR